MTESLCLTSASRRRQLLIFGVLVLSLWFTIMDVIPAAVSFVVLAPIVPALLLRSRRIHKPVAALLALYAYFLGSTLLYAPSSLLAADFYRRDGNFFVTYLPILIGGSLTLRVDLERLMRSFLKWTTVINVVLIGIFLATGGTILFKEQGIFHSLFIAHNAAGGFLATVSSMALGMFAGRRKTPVSFITVMINVAGCVLTDSRGSILGLAGAVVIVFLVRERHTKWILVLAASAQIALLSFTYPAWLNLGKPLAEWTEAQNVQGQDIKARDATILDRGFFLWPRAVYLFLESPIFGTGFGSYNDVPYHLVGIRHLFVYNEPDELIYSAAHAHNTYLHLLAETGLVGLFLFLLMLRRLWVSMEFFEPRSVQLAFRLMLWTAVFSSFTEHRLVTPSEMLPFTILFGVALAASRAESRHAQALSVNAGLPLGAPPGLSGADGCRSNP